MVKLKRENGTPASRRILRIYTEPSFLICVLVLVLACSFMSLTIKGFSRVVKKNPFLLKKSLEFLDEKLGGIYEIESKGRIDNEQIVKELGTEEYIEWVLVDKSEPEDSAVRKCALFITYYSMPDRVPHVPDECYMGAGYQRMGRETVTFKLDRGQMQEELTGRYVVFSGRDDNFFASKKFAVMYVFRVNDEYCGNREAARIAIDKHMFSKHTFFSKVEWRFYNDSFGTLIYPKKEESLKASGELLSVILPILEQEYWPAVD